MWPFSNLISFSYSQYLSTDTILNLFDVTLHATYLSTNEYGFE